MTRPISSRLVGLRRGVKDRATDASALRAIAQAAINVELFTIPLYMVALYSIQGMHQITGENDFYRGRWWPGSATTAHPKTKNEIAFNVVYSVFVEEMLHLQMAANIASAIGVLPDFTSPALQVKGAWVCYGKDPFGDDRTIIPHIIDLRHTKTYKETTVQVGELGPAQLALFRAIEQPEQTARADIDVHEGTEILVAGDQPAGTYFPTVPFAGWTSEMDETDLPMFGSIGRMYQCYYDYLSMPYEDDTTLWDFVFSGGQRDMFNAVSKGHKIPEYPGFAPSLSGSAFEEAVAMMDAITDQGEGMILKKRPKIDTLTEVHSIYRASRDALEKDYPKYDDAGHKVESTDTVARFDNGKIDHYERFGKLLDTIGEVVTWRQWHEKRGNKPWKVEDLQVPQSPVYVAPPYPIPPAQAIADAMNRVGDTTSAERPAMFDLISQAATGSLAGITTVLNDYWADRDVSFPYPSMVGSGDRTAICWALFGEAPDLSAAPDEIVAGKLYHACQGLDFDNPQEACANVGIYHACRGSNLCATQGGCGFVQKTTGGSNCRSLDEATKTVVVASQGRPTVFSAPGDNRCKSYGGCAVPISASQLMPGVKDGDEFISPVTLELFDFDHQDGNKPHSIGTITFTKGENVHDVAYRAYLAVMSQRAPLDQQPRAEPPPPTDIRLVFPPST